MAVVVALATTITRKSKMHMDERKCAYCGSSGPLTREHLWPTSLHARLVDANEQTSNCFWLRRIDKEIEAEPTLRDVCAKCNNGFLSALDGYVCGLFDRYFIQQIDRYSTVEFEFDYHLLKRWLLKVCFNSARIHASRDCFVFDPLLPYIRGDSLEVGRSVQLYAQLTHPSVRKDENGQEFLFHPEDHRVGHVWFDVPGVGRKLLRAVHLRAFSFYLAFYKPGGNSETAQTFSTTFLGLMPKAVLLRPSQPKIALICDGQDAWTSFEAASANSLVFS